MAGRNKEYEVDPLLDRGVGENPPTLPRDRRYLNEPVSNAPAIAPAKYDPGFEKVKNLMTNRAAMATTAPVQEEAPGIDYSGLKDMAGRAVSAIGSGVNAVKQKFAGTTDVPELVPEQPVVVNEQPSNKVAPAVRSAPSTNPEDAPIRIIRGNFSGTGNAGTGGSFDLSDARVDKAGNYVEGAVAPSVFAQQQAADTRKYQAQQAIAERTNPKFNKVVTRIDQATGLEQDVLVDGNGKVLGAPPQTAPGAPASKEAFRQAVRDAPENAGREISDAELDAMYESKYGGK